MLPASLDKRGAGDERIRRAPEDGEGRERLGEPVFARAFIEDTFSVGKVALSPSSHQLSSGHGGRLKAHHVEEQQLGRVWHRRGPEELGDLPRDPVGVGEVEELVEDGVGEISEEPSREVFLSKGQERNELADCRAARSSARVHESRRREARRTAKDELPNVAGGEHAHQAERERLEDLAGVDGRSHGDEARHLLREVRATAAREAEEHGARACTCCSATLRRVEGNRLCAPCEWPT